METVVRKPFQGVTNIIRFNWHFYVIACALILILFTLLNFLPGGFTWIANSIVLTICLTTSVSLIVSYYVYDYSNLYKFDWLNGLSITKGASLVNINAGFDETSAILTSSCPNTDIKVFDFYDAGKHTEISIKRARKRYPPYPNTVQISTTQIPVQESSVDFIFNIFSAHEIRNRQERVNFLKKQNEALKDSGRCIVMEHLRDIPNFFAYNIGYFHFFSSREWKLNFLAAGFSIEETKKITPFVTVFILKKSHGDTF